MGKPANLVYGVEEEPPSVTWISDMLDGCRKAAGNELRIGAQHVRHHPLGPTSVGSETEPRMFRTANTKARKFTRPVILCRRTVGGDCSASIGASPA